MDTKRWASLNTIIDEALELDHDESISFVVNYEGLSEDIRLEAISFLTSIQNSTNFWDRLIESNYELIEHIDEHEIEVKQGGNSYTPGQIGPYKILREIASGGMGVVYLAERADGHLQITVALKVIKRECIDENHIRQFTNERNILGKLNHPHIAHIYDGGITEQGRPYLVMEYVDGRPITKYCSENKCSIDDKLSLIEQICEGVNFAHSNLVVHRDLKPDNIFVKSNGACKILDFGIAKIIDSDGSLPDPDTHSPELKPFSIRHAAPEQLSGRVITTSTDVYGLGLLMYEVLTGTLPFDLHQKTPREAVQIITETPVPPASSKADSKEVAKSLRGDLDAIIQKTLEKDPADRYQSAGDLLADIRSYQKNRPVSIKSDNKLYKLKKFTERNRATASIVLTLLIFLSGLTVYYVNSIKTEQQKAIANEQQATFIAGFMIDLFDASDPVSNISDTLTVYDILQSGVDKLNSWDAPDVSKADIMISLGNAYKKIGDFEQSQTLLENAYEIYHARATGPDDSELLEPTYHLASLHNERRGFENAAHYYHRALSLLDQSPNQSPLITTDIYSGYGNTLSELGNPQLGILYLEKALVAFQRSDLSSNQLRNIQTNLAQALRKNGEYEKSEALYKEILYALPADNQADLNIKATIHNNLGYLLKVQDRLEEAIVHYNQSLEINRYIYGPSHPNTRIVLNNIAGLYKALGHFEKAEEILDELIRINLETFGESHWRTGVAFQAIGILKLQSGNLRKSTSYFEKAASIYTEDLGPEHTWTNRAILYHALSRFNSPEQEFARKQFMEAFTLLKKNRADFSRYDVNLLHNLIRDLETYSSIKSTPEFAMLEEIQ